MTTLSIVKNGSSRGKAQQISTGRDVQRLMLFLEKEDREKFYVLHLDAKNRVLSQELISVGTLTSTIIHPREVFKGAVLNNSAAIVCVHNHPSGDTAPSPEDLLITERLRTAGAILNIPLLDHIIIGEKQRFYSFLEGGRFLAAHTKVAELSHAAVAAMGAAAETTGKTKRKLKDTGGARSNTPSSVRGVNNKKLPETFIQLKSVKTFLQRDVEMLELMLRGVWDDGDDEIRNILFGQVCRLSGRISLRQMNTST